MVLRWIQVCLVIVVVGLVVSGVTAFPLEAELRLASEVLAHPPLASVVPPEFASWVERVRDALIATDAQFPFLAYGTDWLAFAHLLIAVAFLGPLRDPVRNIWVIQWGVIACVGVIPLALIAGPIRGLPLGWTLIDLSFVVAVIPLAIAWRLTRRLERLRAAAAPSVAGGQTA
jgi:hypothetical protein